MRLIRRLLKGLAYLVGGAVAICGAMILLGMTLVMVFLFCFNTLDGHRSEPARLALTDTGLSACAKYAPSLQLTAGDAITVFTLSAYDDHVHHTDLRELLMAEAADLPGWHTDPVTEAEYLAALEAVCPGAGFLTPAGTTLDAWYFRSGSSYPAALPAAVPQADWTLAFFDRDTGLFIHVQDGRAVCAADRIRHGLSIPCEGAVMYRFNTHGGLQGDGRTLELIQLPPDVRVAFAEALSTRPDWHEATVSAAEFARLYGTQMIYAGEPELSPAMAADFDWWFYADHADENHRDAEDHRYGQESFPAAMQSANAACTMNWSAGFYDVDTGLLVLFISDL